MHYVAHCSVTRPFAAVIALAVAAHVLPAHAEPPKVGEAPPALTLEAVLQAPADIRPETLPREDRVTVIDFWATWCAPCIASFPHMNDLVDQFANEPVDFLLITNESVEVVNRFLEDRDLKPWIGIDSDGDVFDNYDIRAIPRAVVIGRDGRIAALTRPDLLTDDILRDIVNRRPVDVLDPFATMPAPAPDDEPTSQSILEISIQTHDGPGGGMMSRGLTQYEGIGHTLRAHLAEAFHTPAGRIRSSTPIDDELYDVVIKVPYDLQATVAAYSEARKTGEPVKLPETVLRAKEKKERLLREALVAAFDLDVHKEVVETDVYILKRIPNVDLKVYAGDPELSGHMSVDDSVLAARNWNIDALISSLEDAIGAPVFDETGLEGKFDWSVQFTPNDPHSLVSAVREQLGLSLEPAVHPVEFVIVEKAGE